MSMPYIVRPVVLAIVLAGIAASPHPHWWTTTYPRGVAVSTRPTTSDEAINAATTFVTRAMTPDCHIDHDPRDAWTRATDDDGVRDDLETHGDMASDDWWRETCHHDGWLSLAVTTASVAERHHDRATVHVRFVITVHRDDGTFTDPWHHEWTVTVDGTQVTGVDTYYDSTTPNPWWQTDDGPIRTMGNRPSPDDMSAIRLGQDLLETRTRGDDVSTLTGDPDSLEAASRTGASTAPVHMHQIVIDPYGVEIRYSHGSDSMWERLSFIPAPCTTNPHHQCVTHHHSSDEQRR